MAISESVGATQAASAAQTASQITIEIMDIIMALLNKSKFKDTKTEKTAKLFMKHIKNGGQIKMQAIDSKNKEIFVECLKAHKTPYFAIEDKDGKTIFITRDRDAERVKDAWIDYMAEIKIGYTELHPNDFLDRNYDQEINITKGFSEMEIEAFRREAGNTNITFAVIKNRDDKSKFDIIHKKNDADLFKRTVLGVQYDFGGKEGAIYQFDLNTMLTAKNAILQTAKDSPDKMQIIINAKNPNHFLTIQNGRITEHNLTKMKKNGLRGEYEIYDDKIYTIYPFGNRELTKTLKHFGSIETVSSLPFITGYDSTGRAIVDVKSADEYINNYNPVNATYIYVRRKYTSISDPILLSNLEQGTLAALTAELHKNDIKYVAVGNDIAIDGNTNIKKTVNSILDKTVYRDMSFDEKFTAKAFYSGHAQQGYDLSGNNPVYIATAKDPAFVVAVNNDGYKILKNGKTIQSMSRNDPGYQQGIENILSKMPDAIIFDKNIAGMKNDDRIATLEKLANNNKNNALNEIKNMYENNKNEFVNNPDKSAVKKYQSYEIETVYVDRTISEKIFDHDVSTKRKEREYIETKETKYERSESR